MPRRDDENSAVSLFSFQDIITSITGIMFLVVLMLVLSLLSSHIPEKTSAQSRENARLKAEAAALQAAVNTLKLHNQDNDRQLAELRKLSPEELHRRLTVLQETLKKMQENFKQQEAAMFQQKSRNDLAEKKLAQLDAMTVKLTESNTIRQKQLAVTQQELQKLRHKFEQQKSLLRYSIERSSGKTPILIELGSDGIQLLDTSTMQKQDLRGKGIEDSLNNLQNIFPQFDPARYYFSAAVKPGGFIYAGKVLQLLKKSGFERGVEILPDDRSSLFQEKEL